MNRKLVFATGNAGKMKEVRMILADMGWDILSMKEAGIKAEPEENGTSYEENALIKARAIAEMTDGLVLADDSGLEIDYLNGEPGVYSARYMGEDTPYTIKNAELIRRLEGVEWDKRSARFVCAIAAVLPDGREFTTRACVEGFIAHEAHGEHGFGYDPIFWVARWDKAMAEVTEEEKNTISHRGKALRLMKEKLEGLEY